MKKTAFAACIALLLLFCIAPSSARAASGNTAEDTFIQANQAGWGITTNTDGIPNYAWQRSLGTGSPFSSIQAGNGVLVYAGTNGHKIAGYVPVPANAGGDVLAKVTFTAVGQAVGGTMLNVARGASWYQADMNTSLRTLELRKRLNGIMTTEAFIPFTYSANTAYWIREDVQVSGGVASVRVRAWADGTSEPTNWHVTWSDSNPLPAGQTGAMGDWFRTPLAGTQIRFTAWAYAATGLALPPK